LRTVDDDARQALLQQQADNTRAADKVDTKNNRLGTDIKECGI
jgi:hypothetical protein